MTEAGAPLAQRCPTQLRLSKGRSGHSVRRCGVDRSPLLLSFPMMTHPQVVSGTRGKEAAHLRWLSRATLWWKGRWPGRASVYLRGSTTTKVAGERDVLAAVK